MSVPTERNSATRATLKIPWISEEVSISKSCENINKALLEKRRRSCSPNIDLSIDKPKVQIGMDRYITVEKRKRSPQSAELASCSKSCKTNGDAMKNNQNRFALLQTEEQVVAKKSFKPPPIYLRQRTSSELVRKLVAEIGKDTFSVTSIIRNKISETKIQTNNENDYRKLSDFLERDRRSFYTFQLKSAKGLQVVIKGIESLVDSEEIKAELLAKGFKVKNIMNIRNREKIPQPMFRIELEPGDIVLKKNETHPIYDLKYLLHRRITVEEPHKRQGPVQCFNCQEFGHTKAYCRLHSVCVVCGELHGTAQCQKSKTDASVKKCSNCGGNHTANYRGCPIYGRIKRTMTNTPSVPAQHPPHPVITTSASLPVTSLPTSHSNAPNSYANMLKSNMPNVSHRAKSQNSVPHTNSIEETVQTLVQSVNIFMGTMTTMMQKMHEMLEVQSKMLQGILNK